MHSTSDRLLYRLALAGHADGVELALDPIGPVVQPRRVLQRGAHHVRDHQRRVGLGELLDELAPDHLAWAGTVGFCFRGVCNRLLEQLLEELAHLGAVALHRARAERRVDEAAKTRVVRPIDVQDVALHLLIQRSLGHIEDLSDLHARKDRRARAQEELARLPVQHEVAERVLRKPTLGAQPSHRLVEALAPQRGVGGVERGQLKLGDERHRCQR